jgi:serine/threonine-protein kinase RsbW
VRTQVGELTTTMIRRDSDAPACARRVLLDSLPPGPRRDDAVLLTSELVTNVVRHAPDGVDEMTLGVTHTPVVAVSVTQGGGFPDGVRPSDSLGGMGLRIVDAVSSRWGFSSDGESLVMWFELAG